MLSAHRSLRLSSGGEFSKKYPLIKASYESKGSRGLFVLGTASHSVDYRKSAGGFIHGFRYTGEPRRNHPPGQETLSKFPTAIKGLLDSSQLLYIPCLGQMASGFRGLRLCLERQQIEVRDLGGM